MRDGEEREEVVADGRVGELVLGRDVVDLADLAAVQDRVERVDDVAGVQVASRWGAVAVEKQLLVAVQEHDEFGDDFWEEGLRLR